jgi:hypothetical protein
MQAQCVRVAAGKDPIHVALLYCKRAIKNYIVFMSHLGTQFYAWVVITNTTLGNSNVGPVGSRLVIFNMGKLGVLLELMPTSRPERTTLEGSTQWGERKH